MDAQKALEKVSEANKGYPDNVATSKEFLRYLKDSNHAGNKLEKNRKAFQYLFNTCDSNETLEKTIRHLFGIDGDKALTKTANKCFEGLKGSDEKEAAKQINKMLEKALRKAGKPIDTVYTYPKRWLGLYRTKPSLISDSLFIDMCVASRASFEDADRGLVTLRNRGFNKRDPEEMRAFLMLYFEKSEKEFNAIIASGESKARKRLADEEENLYSKTGYTKRGPYSLPKSETEEAIDEAICDNYVISCEINQERSRSLEKVRWLMIVNLVSIELKEETREYIKHLANRNTDILENYAIAILFFLSMVDLMDEFLTSTVGNNKLTEYTSGVRTLLAQYKEYKRGNETALILAGELRETLKSEAESIPDVWQKLSGSGKEQGVIPNERMTEFLDYLHSPTITSKIAKIDVIRDFLPERLLCAALSLPKDRVLHGPFEGFGGNRHISIAKESELGRVLFELYDLGAPQDKLPDLYPMLNPYESIAYKTREETKTGEPETKDRYVELSYKYPERDSFVIVWFLSKYVTECVEKEAAEKKATECHCATPTCAYTFNTFYTELDLALTDCNFAQLDWENSPIDKIILQCAYVADKKNNPASALEYFVKLLKVPATKKTQ